MRMSKDKFDHLLSLLEPSLQKKDTNCRKAIPAKKRLVLTLRYLASGSTQQDISFSFHIGRSTCSGIIKRHARHSKVLAPINPCVPASQEEWKKIAGGFQSKWNFANVVGAIDGKHIQIECPKNSGLTIKVFFLLPPTLPPSQSN